MTLFSLMYLLVTWCLVPPVTLLLLAASVSTGHVTSRPLYLLLRVIYDPDMPFAWYVRLPGYLGVLVTALTWPLWLPGVIAAWRDALRDD